MSKLNYAYQKSFSFSRYFKYLLNKMTGNISGLEDDGGFSYNSNAKMLGAFQPLADMFKDFRDTFSAYKGAYQLRKDLLQPLRGLGNTIKAIAMFIIVLVSFLVHAFRNIAAHLRGKEPPITMRQNFYQTFVWLIEGLSTLIRGLTQIAVTPLIYLLETPLRLFITKMKGFRKIEHNRSIRRQISATFELIPDPNNDSFFTSQDQKTFFHTLDIFHSTVNYQRKKGQRTDISQKDEDKKWWEARHGSSDKGKEEIIVSTLKYFSLFNPSIPIKELEKICGYVSDGSITCQHLGDGKFTYQIK